MHATGGACRRRGIAAWALLLLAAGAHADGESGNLRGSAGASQAAEVEQVLVFDAGSSGTRIHVFNVAPVSAAAHVPRVDLSVRAKQTLKVKPGLSHFGRQMDLAGAKKNIEALIEFANTFVPASRRSSTAALLKATAGLRAIPEEQSTAVLGQVRAALASSGYMFQPEWADIIQGKEEAGLAWVAANYLRGTFDENGSSLGVIEMGGGSTQVSFQVDVSEKVAESDSFVFTTALGKEYHLYAHSYLGYGQDYAQAKLRELLPPADSTDPCYPVGYRRRGPSAGDSATIVRGTGDADDCGAKIRERLILSSTDAPGRYAHELPLRGSFAATENFFYVRSGAVLGDGDGALLANDAKLVCSKKEMQFSDEEISKMESGDADAGRPNTCFALSYQAAFLKALKAPSGLGEVRVMRQINGGDVDWALGVALMQLLGQHAKMEQEPFGLMSKLVMGVACILLLLVAWKSTSPGKLWSPKASRDAERGSKRPVKATKFGMNGNKVTPAE